MTEFPVQEIKGIRLGVQPHGIVMRQKMGMQEGVGTIGWKDVYEWYDAPDFILMNFKVKDQPVHISCQSVWTARISFAVIRKHLKEAVGEPKTI